MKWMKIYEWLACSQSDFTRQFQDREALYNQARRFWSDLEGLMPYVFIVMAVIAIGMAFVYYKPYNNKPGRHYTITQWAMFLLLTFAITFVATFLIEYIACEPRLDGAFGVEFRIAFWNSVYALLLYIITSWVWCTFYPTSTNAYPWVKIG